MSKEIIKVEKINQVYLKLEAELIISPLKYLDINLLHNIAIEFGMEKSDYIPMLQVNYTLDYTLTYKIGQIAKISK